MKHRYSVWLVILAAMLVIACGGKGGDNPSEMAGRTAKLYYENLLHGRYDVFVDGFYRPDSIPSSYRSQLIDNARMYVAQMNDDHHGLARIDLIRATADTARNEGRAFLLLCFADSTREEVVVPMVRIENLWMMR
ncbi:MAG: hypothetical protein U0I89_02170 [Prevotella sp.]|nr:hypothetical protein [Prevotella sp.]MEE0336087.1 hypothetical protein [Prevotella sp.]